MRNVQAIFERLLAKNSFAFSFRSYVIYKYRIIKIFASSNTKKIVLLNGISLRIAAIFNDFFKNLEALFFVNIYIYISQQGTFVRYKN